MIRRVNNKRIPLKRTGETEVSARDFLENSLEVSLRLDPEEIRRA
jgi:hypothetical protein